MDDEIKDTEKDTLYTLHTLFTTEDDLKKVQNGYAKGGLSYKESKEILIKHINALILPMRERRFEIAKDPNSVRDILKAGGEKARKRAREKLEIVRKKVGLN